MKRSIAAKLRNQGYDLDLVWEVQNPSPTIYHSDFIHFGNGVGTIVTIYDYPKEVQQQMWFRNLLDTDNTITMLKVGTESRAKVEKALQDAANANNAILGDKWQNDQRKLLAGNEYQQNMADLNDALNGQEVYKRLYVRVLFTERTIEQLRTKLDDFRHRLSNYKSMVYAGEMANHLRQFFVPAMKVQNLALKDKGFPMKAYSLAGTYAFNQTFLADSRGANLATTFQGGEVTFDPSHSDGKHRTTAYNLIIGDAGSGKSTWMHQQLDPLFARGDTIWLFDRTRRYFPHVNQLGGLILTMDGSQNRVNIFHVFGTVLDENGHIDKINSFLQHIEKVKTYYATLNPEANVGELNLFMDELRRFYIEDQEMWSYSPEDHPEELRIIGLDANAYPTLETFISYLQARALNSRDFTADNRSRLENIIMVLKNLLNQYGSKVNGHTNVPDLSDEQLIMFDTSGMAEWDAKVYAAQYFSIMSLMNSYVVMNGYHQLKREQAGEFNKQTVADGTAAPKYFWWIQDEADDVINYTNPLGISFADKMMQQQRKNYFGLFMIFPGLKNVLPTGQQQDSEEARAMADFFNRFQNHHIGRLPEDDKNRYASVTSSSDVTADQLNTLPMLQVGQFLLILRGFQSIFITAYRPTDEELKMYGGGI
ncbi:type IV secretion system protein VirB4 [Weissella paramesenteroides]|uniref:type IV secretion system protein VirB4 n=1 Tax=Weissella paramesenteroides TaxID=1249 RepID=UPI003F26D99C